MANREVIYIKQCSSATCQGNESGCGSGDCNTSSHHARNARWKAMSEEDFIYLFDREPNRRQHDNSTEKS